MTAQESSTRRTDRVQRALKCLVELLICPEEVTIEKLSASNKVSRRTACRDLAVLREAGIPIEYDKNQGHCRISSLEPILQCAGQSIWPLSWEKSVILFAFLEAVIGGRYEEHRDLAEIKSKLAALMRLKFQDRAGSVLLNARILSRNPRLSAEVLSRFMEAHWQDTEERAEAGRPDQMKTSAP